MPELDSPAISGHTVVREFSTGLSESDTSRNKDTGIFIPLQIHSGGFITQ